MKQSSLNTGKDSIREKMCSVSEIVDVLVQDWFLKNINELKRKTR